jgi:ADP-ribose pyrophosphatase
MKKLDHIEHLGDVPPVERGEPFLRVVTLRLRNHYKDAAPSPPYLCDVMLPRWVDAVAAVLYTREDDGVRVGLKECLRPAVFVRRELDLPAPEPNRSPFVLEVVAGRLEPGDDGAEGIARRVVEEAREEAGLVVDPAGVRLLGSPVFTSPGTCPEKLYVAAVEVDPARRVPVAGDGSPMEETGAFGFVPLDEAIAMCRSGAIEDAKTEIALLRFRETL